MNRKDAKKLIDGWFTLNRVNKSKYWDKIVPYINKYPDIYMEGIKRIKEKQKAK